MKNMVEISSFKSCLLNISEHGNDGFVFESFVTYEALNKTVTEILDVYLILGGYEPVINMDIYSKGRIITSDKYHLDLNPKFDSVTFTHTGKFLIIEGKNSPKIGNYKITFEELS